MSAQSSTPNRTSALRSAEFFFTGPDVLRARPLKHEPSARQTSRPDLQGR